MATELIPAEPQFPLTFGKPGTKDLAAVFTAVRLELFVVCLFSFVMLVKDFRGDLRELLLVVVQTLSC